MYTSTGQVTVLGNPITNVYISNNVIPYPSHSSHWLNLKVGQI